MQAGIKNISERDYRRLCKLVQSEAGIHLSGAKQTMLEVRISRRMHALGLDSYHAYCDFLFSADGKENELVHFIDVVTTNKTDFFREAHHFQMLTSRVLPEFARRGIGYSPFLAWSAGCSSGEEPYTLAMVLSEYAAEHADLNFRILATDISTRMLERAADAIYPDDVVRPVPAELQRRYFMRSKDHTSHRVRVVPELRKTIEFRRLNFMDADFGIHRSFSIVFCRNVMIYFDRATQEQILGKICRCLIPGGYLFSGHAESLHDMRLPLDAVAPALYRKRHDKT